ncbi:Gfo/Idh/MocA family oxidoreductase [Dongia sp.]|uniref:Gfo/Idh/MocA family oxidoreductase n=1 Tax=Dongia sp. TaxID=1977262 RepID=UPI0035B42F6F
MPQTVTPAAATSPQPLRLGVIGSSPGNGHPYSWAAICNGYNDKAMADCPYPGIPAYLAQRRFPEDRLKAVAVTHLWTQDPAQSRHIAAASLIPQIVENPEDMISAVDGLLLARDDAENHRRFALPFLRAGLPVCIDKPLALSRQVADELLAEERYPGQIFAGTAVAWAAEMTLSAEERRQLGGVRHVSGVTPKYWDTYGVHIIEPALQLLGLERAPDELMATGHGTVRLVNAVWHDEGFSAQFAAMGGLNAPIALTAHGETGHRQLVFTDSFSAFRNALEQFCEGVRHRERRFNLARTLAVTDIIERGRAQELRA